MRFRDGELLSPVHLPKDQGNQVSSSFPALPSKNVPVAENFPLISPSVFETLGEFDTESEGSSGKNVPVKGETIGEKLPLPKETKAPWVNLFKDNRKPNESLALHVYDNLPDRVDLDEDDADDLELTWCYCLIGYFAGRFPRKKALLNLCSSWNVEYEYFTHSSGWLVFKFHDETFREKVLKGGPYFVFGRPLLLKNLPEYFRFNDEEISIMPVWFMLTELPLNFWNPKGLGKIASKIGKPISMDNLTSLRGRLSYARVLIEVDAAKELVRTVNIGLPNGDVYDQKVIFEHEPKFCSFCRTFGHSHSSCAFCDKTQEHGPKVAAQRQPDVQISEKERQNSGTKEPTVGAVALPNSVQDTPATATSIQRSQAQSVANVPLIVPSHNQGQTLQAEGDDDFILVE
ncbi:Uncharacterized protein Adt_13472 [Abeliophyllum distichum]|uniref:DUF4283 domain-containing protein n=1 Tax=Abeliophyllum distichum TaxID=126358 RepID=A0ABD1TWX1_9LAMI